MKVDSGFLSNDTGKIEVHLVPDPRSQGCSCLSDQWESSNSCCSRPQRIRGCTCISHVLRVKIYKAVEV